jgi:hypothetical protein
VHTCQECDYEHIGAGAALYFDKHYKRFCDPHEVTMPGFIIDGRSRARLFIFLLGILLFAGPAFAQQKPKLRQLRIALPSHSVSSTAIYVARSLGVFESYGFDPQILVLEPRAALAALLTGDLDFYTAAGTVGRAALRGVPVRVVLVSFNRSDLVLLASKEITKIEQLRGKALGGYTAQASVNVRNCCGSRGCDLRSTVSSMSARRGPRR